MTPASRMSPWWPSTSAGRIALILWLLAHAALWRFGGSLLNAAASAATWYLIIVGVRALAYPQRPARG